MSEINRLHHRFCQYSLTFKGNTPRTIKWFKDDFKWFQKFAQIESIEQLTKQLIESWIYSGKLEHNWSARTIRLRIQALSLFLDWCVNEEIIKENPCKRIPKPKLPKSIPKSLTEEQASKFTLILEKHNAELYKNDIDSKTFNKFNKLRDLEFYKLLDTEQYEKYKKVKLEIEPTLKYRFD